MKLHTTPLSTDKLQELITIAQEIKNFAASKENGDNTTDQRDKILEAVSACLEDDSITTEDIYHKSSVSGEPLSLGEEVHHGDLQGIIIGFIHNGTKNPEKDGFTMSYIFDPRMTNGVTYPEHNIQLQVGDSVLYCSARHVSKRNK